MFGDALQLRSTVEYRNYQRFLTGGRLIGP